MGRTMARATPEEEQILANALLDRIGRSSGLTELRNLHKTPVRSGGLPGFDYVFLKEVMGSVEGQLRSVVDSEQTDDMSQTPTSTLIQAPTMRVMTIRGAPEALSAFKDDQLTQFVHSYENQHGKELSSMIQVRVKRKPTSRSETLGPLREIYIRDSVGGGFIGLNIIYTNPSIDTSNPQSNEVVFSSLDILRPPEDYEAQLRAIQEFNDRLRTSGGDAASTSQIETWHDFLFWKHSASEINPYAVFFDEMPIPWEILNDDNAVGTYQIIEGDRVDLALTPLSELTSNEDRVLRVGLYPKGVLVPGQDLLKAPISFRVPAMMTLHR